MGAPKHFVVREQLCDRCGELGHRRAHCRVPGIPKAQKALGVFPGAAVARVEDLPLVCPRPGCGGPWRVIPGGRGCLICARAVYVSALLADYANHPKLTNPAET